MRINFTGEFIDPQLWAVGPQDKESFLRMSRRNQLCKVIELYVAM